VCHRVSVSQPGRLLCTCRDVFAAIARPGGHTWCTQRDAGASGQYLPQGCTVYRYIYFLYLLCDEVYVLYLLHICSLLCAQQIIDRLALCYYFLHILLHAVSVQCALALVCSSWWISQPRVLLIIFSHRRELPVNEIPGGIAQLMYISNTVVCCRNIY
jgi:hypothetical protein